MSDDRILPYSETGEFNGIHNSIRNPNVEPIETDLPIGEMLDEIKADIFPKRSDGFDHFLSLSKEQRREAILNLEATIIETPGSLIGDNERCPLKHHFSPGIYTREIFIPKDQVLTGKIHKHQHPNFLIQGEVIVVTEDGGIEHLVAPMFMLSPSGTKRAVLTKTDTIWYTLHSNPTNTTDLTILEKDIIAGSYEEFDEFIKSAYMYSVHTCFSAGKST